MKKDSSFEVRTTEQIKTSLPRSGSKCGIPESASFMFQELYRDIAAGIQTTGISADYIPYSM